MLHKLDVFKKHIILSILGIFGVIFLLWFVFWRGIEATDNSYIKGNITLLSAKVGGYVTHVLVDDNQSVKMSDIIAKIDNRDYIARVNQAESQLESTKANLSSLQNQKDLQIARVRQAESGIESAKATLDKTSKDYARSKTLVKDGAISQQFLDTSTAEQKNAQATLERNLAELDVAKSQLAVTIAQIQQAEAQLKNAESAVILAKIDLEHTEIKAPAGGVLGNRAVQVGQLLRPGTVLGYLVPTNEIWIEANFKETQVEKMKPGQSAVIEIDTFSGKKFHGKVHSLAPASGSEFSLLPPENATGNFTKIVRRIPVKIVFDTGIDLMQFRPGMSVVVEVNTRS